LRFSLSLEGSGSHVPHTSLVHARATCVPDAAQAVGRSPLRCSREAGSLPDCDAVLHGSTPQRWFACAHLLAPHLTPRVRLFLNAHDHGF
jgi:hypothetical protein